jgi:hypothetical protein
MNSVKSPTNYSSQDPVDHPDDEDYVVLRLGEIPEQDIHQRHNANHETYPKPPQNPSVNS